MLKKLLGAAAMAATAYAFVPAQRRTSITPRASVSDVAATTSLKRKAGSRLWPTARRSFVAEREIAQAQDAMLSGIMSGCSMHLSRALRAESVAQTPYRGRWAWLRSQVQPRTAPALTTQGAPPQPQFNWTPLQGAY
jgi:hypothetical protein